MHLICFREYTRSLSLCSRPAGVTRKSHAPHPTLEIIDRLSGHFVFISFVARFPQSSPPQSYYCVPRNSTLYLSGRRQQFIERESGDLYHFPTNRNWHPVFTGALYFFGVADTHSRYVSPNSQFLAGWLWIPRLVSPPHFLETSEARKSWQQMWCILM